MGLQEVDLAPAPVVSFVVQAGDAEHVYMQAKRSQTHVKDPVLQVRVQWIIKTFFFKRACTVSQAACITM